MSEKLYETVGFDNAPRRVYTLGPDEIVVDGVYLGPRSCSDRVNRTGVKDRAWTRAVPGPATPTAHRGPEGSPGAPAPVVAPPSTAGFDTEEVDNG